MRKVIAGHRVEILIKSSDYNFRNIVSLRLVSENFTTFVYIIYIPVLVYLELWDIAVSRSTIIPSNRLKVAGDGKHTGSMQRLTHIIINWTHNGSEGEMIFKA